MEQRQTEVDACDHCTDEELQQMDEEEGTSLVPRYLEDSDVPGETLHRFVQLASFQSLLLTEPRKILMEIHSCRNKQELSLKRVLTGVLSPTGLTYWCKKQSAVPRDIYIGSKKRSGVI